MVLLTLFAKAPIVMWAVQGPGSKGGWVGLDGTPTVGSGHCVMLSLGQNGPGGSGRSANVARLVWRHGRGCPASQDRCRALGILVTCFHYLTEGYRTHWRRGLLPLSL